MIPSPSQLVALRNLASKQAGQAVDWINIADARTLTELGLADRSREGWRITAAGLSALLKITESEVSGENHIFTLSEIISIRNIKHEGK